MGKTPPKTYRTKKIEYADKTERKRLEYKTRI